MENLEKMLHSISSLDAVIWVREKDTPFASCPSPLAIFCRCEKLVLGSWEWESWFCPPLASALWRVSSAPNSGSTVELTCWQRHRWSGAVTVQKRSGFTVYLPYSGADDFLPPASSFLCPSLPMVGGSAGPEVMSKRIGTAPSLQQHLGKQDPHLAWATK